ncbi:alpha/beta fold hydrolase [uncultured Roseobacter sp.]|uniref:alpha/beta hydrolase family esterase n=1 Tax=uncultured Roseobacter sp. TaxID=114847 RepID=UPI00262C40C6|nr:alpha/beta fold hydrolase [uncultured Roseobacter sp.]
MKQFLAAVAALCLTLPTGALANCGASEDACEVAGGSYHARLPEGPIKGAILYLHGFGGSGEGALRSRGWSRTALARGYAVIAPDGLPIAEGRGRGWSFIPGRPERRDETVFLQAVRDDAAARFGFEPGAVILAGFSVGGSMTSYMACRAPQSFTAYAPVAGGFWRPHPTSCAGPVRLLHTHGWSDSTVPLEGRVLRGQDARDPEALMQGDIPYTLAMWREVNGCYQLRADRFVTQGAFLRRAWDRCADDTALEFALFPGGHVVPEGWADMMLDWYEGL